MEGKRGDVSTEKVAEVGGSAGRGSKGREEK